MFVNQTQEAEGQVKRSLFRHGLEPSRPSVIRSPPELRAVSLFLGSRVRM